MKFEDRVRAVAEIGFTERQARFLTTVMLHAGVCVPRQYARFASIAYGHKVNRFFDKLVQRRYATVSACRHNRAQLYHVRHHTLYGAIGQPDSRYRRPVSGRLAVERLMLLDAVLSSPELTWLGDEREKVAFFALMVPSLAREDLPHTAVGTGQSGRARLFPEQLPIGVTDTGRVVFFYPVTSPLDAQLRAFAQRHSELLCALPGWTLRLLFSPNAAGMMASCEALVRDELTRRFSAAAIAELKWYFEQCRGTADHRTRCRSDERFATARETFATARCRHLYQRWLTDGDRVLDVLSSTTIGEALKTGAARVESHVLPHAYRHLSPLANQNRARAEGVEEGDEASASPQPPSDVRSDVDGETARHWYPIVDRSESAGAASI
jgi:hypothetical protein